jgi:hypothetical protein
MDKIKRTSKYSKQFIVLKGKTEKIYERMDNDINPDIIISNGNSLLSRRFLS